MSRSKMIPPTLKKCVGVLFGRDGEREAVSDPRLGEDVPWLRRIRLDLLSEMVDEDAQVLDFVAVVGSPDRLEQLAMRNGTVRVGDQKAEQIQFFRCQANLSVSC